ncbi:MAG: GrpB family protein [Butyricimonas faecihominis]
MLYGVIRINHIGSTSDTRGIVIAKPTIDILLEIPTDADIPSLTAALISAGYICNTQPNGMTNTRPLTSCS